MQEITPNVNEEKAAAEVHSYIKDMVAKYHHRPIPTTPAAGNVKTYYRDKLPAWAKKKISRKYPLYTKNGEKVCERYERIVIGDYGAYVEISASHLSDNHFIYIDQNDPIDETISSRHSSHMTLALNDESSYVSVSAVECQDPKNAKNILWQKLCKRYEEMLPLSKNLTTELYPDWEHMTYPDVNSRCEDFARQNIANSYLTHLNAGQQMIPPHLLMPYVEESINYLQSEYGKNEYREKVQFLKKVFIDLNADDSIVRNIQPQFKTEEEPVINENTETDLEK